MKLNSLISTFLAATGVALVASAMPAEAASFGLTPTHVETNKKDNPIPQPGQLSINFEEFGKGKVKFTIANNNIGTDTVSSRISKVIFGGKDKKFFSLLSWRGLIDKDNNFELGGNRDVDFTKDTGYNIGNPPKEIGWKSSFTVERDGKAKWGIDVDESLGVLFALKNGVTFSQIEQGFNSGDLAIASKVGSLEGGNEWYVTSSATTVDVPEPFTILGTTMAFGFAGLCKGEYDKKKKKQKVTT
jgi:hypothetical protein